MYEADGYSRTLNYKSSTEIGKDIFQKNSTGTQVIYKLKGDSVTSITEVSDEEVQQGQWRERSGGGARNFQKKGAIKDEGFLILGYSQKPNTMERWEATKERKIEGSGNPLSRKLPIFRSEFVFTRKPNSKVENVIEPRNRTFGPRKPANSYEETCDICRPQLC
ncbi:hypothetical protein J6590_017156 [Homalodisca vitripennis]|nr:hypothetical protein J6590_017156 [Homalodisca vitripennis]